MPPTTENIPDKASHDVYGTMVILTFLFVGVASWLLYDHLTLDWAYGIEPRPDRATTITQYNEVTMPVSEYIKVSDAELKEWQLAAKHYYGEDQEFPQKSFQWPAGFDPVKTPVKANVDNLTAIPENARRALLANYSITPSPVPVPVSTPAPPPAPAPTPPVAQ